MAERKKLMTSFLIWFTLLVVAPVSAIFFVLKTVYQQIVVDNYVEYIVQKEKNIADALYNEIHGSSLLLASICLVNNSELLNLASDMHTSEDSIQRLQLASQLSLELNYTFSYRSEIGSIVVFFDDKGSYYYRNNMVESDQQARVQKWYQQTLKNNGKVNVLGIKKGSVSNSKTRYTIDLAYSVDDQMAQTQVELVKLSYFTHALEQERELKENRHRGNMLIVDGDGLIMMSDKKELEGHFVQDISYLTKTFENGESYQDVVDGTKMLITPYEVDIQGLNWKIINLSDYNLVLKEADMVSAVFFLIMFAILLLFIGFVTIFFRRIQEQEQERMKIEMEVLQSQINPHFISNSLNAIRFMAIVAKFKSIEKMANALIKILNTTFTKGKEITVKEEIEMIREYIYLMQIRYGGKFSVEFHIAEDILDCKILKLILQPILENAIIHGFDGKESDCNIEISAYQEAGVLIFKIIDNGNGMTLERITTVMTTEHGNAKGMFGIGMSNVQKRITLQYGLAYGMEVSSEISEYTQVVLRLPMMKDEITKEELANKELSKSRGR